MSDDFQKRFERITKKNFKPPRSSGFVPVLAALALITLLLAMIGWLVHAALDPLPRLIEVDRSRAPIQTGIHQKKFWLGRSVSESIHYRDGARSGRTMQYYPNGATFRELAYKNGELDGVQREFEQKAVATLSRRMAKSVKGAGSVRWTRNYRAGVWID